MCSAQRSVGRRNRFQTLCCWPVPFDRCTGGIAHCSKRVGKLRGKRLKPCFEISIRNVEKPEIATSDLERRLEQFQCDDDTLVITRAATFVEKARLMPGTTFAIGFDTAVRLFDDRFYDASDCGSPTIVAMNELRSLDSSFVVGGRHDDDGIFRTASDLAIPEGFETLLLEIPEEKFSDPISSTDIRRSSGPR